MQTANWFLAFPVSSVGWFDALTRTPAGARYFHRDDLHVTLSFLGAVEEEDALRAWEVAKKLESAPFEFPLGHVEAMGPAANPSAWSIVPRKPMLDLNAFLAIHRNDIAAAAHARADSRPPRPHITIARPRRLATARQRADLEHWAELQQVPQVSITLDEIALYTWSTEQDHRLFRIVERRRLSSP